ncbi:histidine kinase [Microbacterium sp. NM3R9]|uniref:sensor histidine kinase n=1 Tax=Microbacterium thalli TaxID=3027921 RepID=UPI002366E747|nr:histidine kinase [Microbacterium thalli]MDN8549261.1 histidine kinase [Microbacterium thalli]
MSSPRRMPSVTDVVVALGTGAATLASLIAAPQLFAGDATVTVDTAAWWISGAVLASQAIALCFARRAPVSVLFGTSVGALLVGVLAPTGLGSLADAAVLVAVLRTTLLVPPRRLKVLLPLAGALVAGGQTADILGSSAVTVPGALGAALLQAVAIVALPAAGVLAVTARRDAHRARVGETEAMRRERAAVVEAAVARERTAMARELHDIAAHHVSSIALMAGVIERQIATDPDAARVAVRQVREQSRVLLDDLRQLVGLLRRDGDERDAVETLETVTALVESARATGRVVDLTTAVGGGQVGPLGQLVIYRMVQEALANAARHAPGASCEVHLDGTRPDVFIATVRNAPAASSIPSSDDIPAREGFGLLGMRERAGLVGGTLEAGPDAAGGWVVRLTVPAEPTNTPGGPT